MTDEIRKAIGARLRELRESSGGSRRELAEALGTYYGRVCNWENGRVAPNERYLEQLSAHYGVSVAFLMGAEEAA